MALTAVTARPASSPARPDRASCAGCVALERRVAALEARLAPGPRDRHDVALVRVLASVSQGLPFTATGMWRCLATDPVLADAILACDIDDARQLGVLLKRLAGHAVDGLCLRRMGKNREGIVLQVWREQE
jgi:hypothetical protein